MSKLSILEAITAHAQKVKAELDKKLTLNGGDSKDVVTTYTSVDRNPQSDQEDFMSVGLYSSGEKHSSIFNKLSKLAYNVRLLILKLGNKIDGSGQSGYLAKFSGNKTLENGPQIGNDITKFLRNDGQWATPPSGGDGNVYYFQGDDNGFYVSENGETPTFIGVNPVISSNITGNGNTGYIAKFSGANTLESGPRLGSDTATYLRNDGQWAEPYSLATQASAGLLRAHKGDVNWFLSGNGTWRNIQNNATTNSEGYVLDARMGKTLNDKIVTTLADVDNNGLLRKLPSDSAAGVRYLKGDGTWARLSRGSADADGTPGLVPAPTAAHYNDHTRYFLSEAGTWRIPPNATADLPGYMTAAQYTKLSGIASGAKASGIPTNGITAGTTSVNNGWTLITELTHLTISTAGAYLVMCTATVVDAATTGSLAVVVNTVNTGMGAAPSVTPFGSNGCTAMSFYAYTISSSTTFYALCKQSSGSAKSVKWNFGVFRLA